MGQTESVADNCSPGECTHAVFTKGDLRKLYKRFCKLDKDNSGFLEPEEFFGLKDLGENPLVKRVIKIFDKNSDGKISFVEFVQGLAN